MRASCIGGGLEPRSDHARILGLMMNGRHRAGLGTGVLRCIAWRSNLLAIAGYATVATAFAWPLPLHLSTHLTGGPGGDTGVSVWNQWVFQHEVLEGRQPAVLH